MATLDILTTAKLLIERHGLQARTYADCQALEELLCGDAAASEDWEQVSEAVEALLEGDPTSRSVAA